LADKTVNAPEWRQDSGGEAVRHLPYAYHIICIHKILFFIVFNRIL